MTQTITLKIRLRPNDEQAKTLETMMRDYILKTNEIVSNMIEEGSILKLTSKNIDANLPSIVKNEMIRDAMSIFKKAKKTKFEKIPKLKKPYCTWNNQNYRFDFEFLYFPIMVDGKAKKTPIRADLVDKDNRNFSLLNNKLGAMRITKKSDKWYALIPVTVETEECVGEKSMGVDLGLKVPAVAYTECGKVRFFGNGRENKYVKRKFRSVRKDLGKRKKPEAIEKMHDKEQRWMKDKDHKVSRQIVDFAKENGVSVIRLEKLQNIRKTARTSRKNNHNLHTWSFYRLASYIEYKANLEGIKVEYVDPAYTSQTCPSCNERNKAKDRLYSCSCGFTKHRDIVGAMNILKAPVVDGKSPSA